ncbi:MAG: hypothetical protein HC904_11525 [Blastochloris sp.]|nr:hypothetical protein [Blastochloris sp.]
MKYVSFALGLLILSGSILCAQGQEKAVIPSIPPELQFSWEPGSASVLKTFIYNEDESRFRAYQIKWRNHDVIVTDRGSFKDFKEGEEIHFIVAKQKIGENLYDLSFRLLAARSTAERSVPNSPEAVTRPVKKEISETPAKGTSTVLKVLSYTEGKHKFSAYQIKWKGHEVIVPNQGAFTNFKEGETIHFLIEKQTFGKNQHDIRFLLLGGHPHLTPSDLDENK